MSARLRVLLDESEFAEIRRVAKRHRMTVAEWVRQALRAELCPCPRRSIRNSRFDSRPAEDGIWVAFLQQANAGVSQGLSGLDLAPYELTFWVAGRNRSDANNGDASYSVFFNDVLIGSGTTSSGDSFTMGTAMFTPTASTGTLKFVNTSGTGDHTFMLDNVDAVATPEPASMVLLGTGLLGIGGLVRRRKHAA